MSYKNEYFHDILSESTECGKLTSFFIWVLAVPGHALLWLLLDPSQTTIVDVFSRTLLHIRIGIISGKQIL
jgi:hypothetical protein